MGSAALPAIGELVRLGPRGTRWYRVLRVTRSRLVGWADLDIYPVTDPAAGEPRCDGPVRSVFYCLLDLIRPDADQAI